MLIQSFLYCIPLIRMKTFLLQNAQHLYNLKKKYKEHLKNVLEHKDVTIFPANRANLELVQRR